MYIEILYERRDAECRPTAKGAIKQVISPQAEAAMLTNAVMRQDTIKSAARQVPDGAVPVRWRFVVEGDF